MTDSVDVSGIDFGPLSGLVGTWKGGRGRDIAPEPDGSEENAYYETLTFEPVGDVVNAERQTLVAIRYVQTVHRKADHKLIHNEVGYWMWDAETETVMHSLAIPRAVCVLATGTVVTPADATNATTFELRACSDGSCGGIVESSFMRDHARTQEFRQKVVLDGDQLSYTQTTIVEIYGKTFEHTDENVLTRR